jgi:hypothetical protein
MKKVLSLVVIMTALVPIFIDNVYAEAKEGLEVSRTAQGIDFTQTIDVSNWESFSAQAVYGDGTPSSHTIYSGGRAISTITVVSNSDALISTQASVTINVASMTGVSGDSVILGGIVFREGVQWSAVTSTTVSAANLKNIINAHPDFEATSAGSTVTVRYSVVGTIGNGLPATTTDNVYLTTSASTFTGGINQHTITINGTTLTEGVDFRANSSSQTTANNITVAINANSTLNTQVVASSSVALVTLRALSTGYSNYSLGSSTTGFLTSIGFPGGSASDVDIQNDVFTKTSHGLTTGLKVLVSTPSGAGPIPSGLIGGTTYFAIKLNENRYALAANASAAEAGTKIDITGIANGATMDVRPLALALAAGNGFYWSASNDNSNFTALPTVTYSSVTYSGAGNTLWSFGSFPYRYLRVNFVGPTSGGISLGIRIYGKEQ